jgi:adenosylcobinamide-GDP ribazoletransferase
MGGLALAVSFLTRIPVRAYPASGTAVGGVVGWFPVVGLGVGAMVGGVTAALAAVGVVPLVAGLVAVGAGMMLTGAFHEDGWADTFDGLAGGYTPERRLEIMKDSRIGTFGAAALFVAVGAKASLLAAMADLDWWRIVAVVGVAGALSRTVSVWWMPRVSPAAPGLGSEYLATVSRIGVGAATVVGLAGAVALGPGGAIGLVVAFVVGSAPVWWARRAIGGVTGDTFGAIQIGSEIGFLAAVEVVRWWW